MIVDIIEYYDRRDLCYQIKSEPRSKYIPVIFISETDNLKKICKNSFANDYLTKPFDI